MSQHFSRSLRSLEADRFRGSLAALVFSTVLLGAWIAWFLLARVSVYAVSETARLEVNEAIYPVQASASGRISASHLVLGQQVQKGDLLVELEDEADRLQLLEERARLAALQPQIERLHSELAALERSRSEDSVSGKVSLQESQARLQEAQAATSLAREEEKRAAELHASGLVSDLDLLRAKAEVQRRRAAETTLRLAVTRLQSDLQSRGSDQDAKLERSRRELAALEGQLGTETATVQRLEQGMEGRRIRAPVSGRVAETAELRVGAVVATGDRLGAIIPTGQLGAVAQFSPQVALGWIRQGQKANVRLTGFPWTQYGSIHATVRNVATEVRDGAVRVELDLQGAAQSQIPVQHGLPGSVEVEVGSSSPAALVLRAAGRLTDPKGTPAAPVAR